MPFEKFSKILVSVVCHFTDICLVIIEVSDKKSLFEKYPIPLKWTLTFEWNGVNVRTSTRNVFDPTN